MPAFQIADTPFLLQKRIFSCSQALLILSLHCECVSNLMCCKFDIPEIPKAKHSPAWPSYCPRPAADVLLVCAGMAEGLGSSIESLVGQSHLRDLLLQCCQVCRPSVCNLTTQRSHCLYVTVQHRGCTVCMQPHNTVVTQYMLSAS